MQFYVRAESRSKNSLAIRTVLFPFRASTACEKAFLDPRISFRAHATSCMYHTYRLMHSRITFPTDRYVAMLHNRYLCTYVRTYMWKLRVESTTIREQLMRCPTDQSVLSIVEPVRVVRLAISKIARWHTMTTGGDIAGPSTSGFAWEPQRQRFNDISWLVSRSVSNESRRVPRGTWKNKERESRKKKQAIVFMMLLCNVGPFSHV